MSGHVPPRRLERLLERSLPAGLSGQGTLGDLAEEFERRARRSPWGARFWYARQTLSLLLHHRLKRSDDAVRRPRLGLGEDLRWSVRSILRRPGFAVGIVLVLGLGLGANVAVFSVVDGTLQNTSWWAAPEATAAIWPDRLFSFGELDMYRREQAVYRALGGYAELAFAVQTADGDSISVNGVMMTPELFRELAVQPIAGRGLVDDDAAFGSEPVVVIGESLWRGAFGADPALIGSRITVSGSPVTVVGVQDAAGRAPGGLAELWFPLIVDPRDDDFWKARSYKLVGVLRDGRVLDDAHADLMAYAERLSEMFPMFFPRGFAVGLATVAPAEEAQRRIISTPLTLLLIGTGLLMVLTALNVGNLLLGRAIARRSELAVRLSLGAGRGRIVRQLLVEGELLTGAALLVGLCLGAFAGPWIARLFVEQAVVDSSPVLSPRVLGFAVVVAVASWLVVNGVPIAHFLRSHRRGPAMKVDSGAGMQRLLVCGQAALATLLLVLASLLVATVDNLRQVPLGFDPEGVLTVELSTPGDRVDSPAVARQLYDRLVERVSEVPGAGAVGLTGWLPLRAQAPTTPINLESAPVDQREATTAPMHMVDAGFFEVFDVEPVAGRLLDTRETEAETYARTAGMAPGPSAVVVNESLAAILWPDGNAVGQLVAIDPHAWDTWVPVVGVIPDIRSGRVTGPTGPALYVSLSESPSRDVTLVVRSSTKAATLAPMVRAAVREVDALVPIRVIAAMRDVVRAAYSTSWVMMGLLSMLAMLATGLGAIGIYAVLAHHVALERREIGVRMALGAGPAAVVSDVVRAGLVLAMAGIAVGSVAAAISTRFLESLLYDVSALAPWAFVAPAAALTVAAALAAWIPATRAGRLPPADVLRTD